MDIITNSVDYHDPINGKVYPLWLSEAVDELLYKVRKKNIWEIVDFCLDIWAQKYPKDHKKYLNEMKVYKKNRLNKYGSTKSKVYRELLSLPREINYLLDKIAADKIADYGPKKFWRDFAIRYPVFSPAESV